MNATYRFSLLMIAIMFCAPAFAQYGGMGGATDGLTATGSEELSLTPGWLEMSIQIEGRSSDLPQAAKELRRRIDLAKERLETLKAISDSVTVSKPSLKGEADAGQQARMQQMMRQYGGGKKGREMLEKTKSVSIVQTITARWEIAGEDDLSRMIAAKELTDKINAADVASSSENQPVSAAQAEVAEELMGMMDQYDSYGEETVKTGEPTFSYVAILTTDEYQAAIKSAFEDAAKQISSLAEATEASVEPTKPMMVNLRVGDTPSGYGYREASQPARKPNGDYELAATSPTEAKCTVSVYAVSKHK